MCESQGGTKYKKTQLLSTERLRDCAEYLSSLLRGSGGESTKAPFSMTANQEPRL